ncbi:MAG: hypothetical protein KJ922_03360, partial [Nanoarchaeota archaeon]|nr:hypothetical protein [Nanoarchaeota archaeon]
MDDDDDKPISLGDIKNIFKRKKADKVEDLKHDTADVEADIKEKKEKAAQLSKEAAKETKEVEEIEKEIEQEEVEAEVIDEEQSRLDDKKKEFNKEIKHTKKEISETKEKAASEDDENIKLDLGKVKDFFKPKGDFGIFFKKYGTILLLLIPIFFAVFFRAYPYTLPATDEWAQNSVENALKSQIATQINQQYPNLPAANKQKQIDDEYEKMRNERKTEIDQQIEATSNYFKSRLQNEDGQTYLLAIDPYLWYGEARNIINNGHPGDKLVDGKPVYTLRDGRFDKPIEFLLHPWIIAYTYKFMKVFDKSTTILQAAFIIPLLLIALSVIPAFFIGRKIAGNVGGVFAGSLLALNAALLGRTPAGFSDTDAYNIVLPVFAAWFFVEAFKAKDLKKEVMWNILAGLSLGIFAVSWGGWWYTFDFILAAIAGYLFIMLIHTYWKNELLKNAVYSISAMLGFIALALFSSGFFQYIMLAGIIVSFIAGVINILKNWKGFVKADKEYFKQYKNKIIAGALFFVSTGVFVSLLRSPQIFLSSMLGKPTSVITMKDVATDSIWPNVLTTVAEFNESSMTSVIGQMG